MTPLSLEQDSEISDGGRGEVMILKVVVDMVVIVFIIVLLVVLMVIVGHTAVVDMVRAGEAR